MSHQPGFMIYASDWNGILEDYDAEEVGDIFIALLRYHATGELTEFRDRGMRTFFRQAVKFMDLDRLKYEEKCRTNSYNRYRRACKEKGDTPLSRDEWLISVMQKSGEGLV